MKGVESWLKGTKYKDYLLSLASADASFRKYYRISKDGTSFIVMDASLELDSLQPFVNVTRRLLDADVKAPHILEQDLAKGYLILEDFGSVQLLENLTKENFKGYYTQAIDTILKMQKSNAIGLPLYDKAFLHFEMDLMQEWFLQKYLQLSLNTQQKELIALTLDAISEVVLSQPQNLFVHRDFHSRNIMLTPDAELGVIDYQDAMSGAITYDLVSLLKDCYIAFKPKEIEKLALLFRDRANLKCDDAEFIKWFDFMGLQRHIKVLGIFSRLYLRDAKDGYLKDIPLTLDYTIQAAKKYDETREFALLLETLRESV